MQVDLYSASVGVFGRGLNGLSATLSKGSAHAAMIGLAEAELLDKRLHPSMYPLYRQVQTACDLAAQSTARMAGVTVPEALEGERDVSGLQADIRAVQGQLKAYSPAQFEGRDEALVTFPIGAEPPVTYPAAQYLLGFVTPNFFFHFVTAYGILRAMGVELGKRDYFGS